MIDLLTREEMAKLHGVTPITVDMWTAQGLPTVEASASAGGKHPGDRRTDWRISRRDFARLVNIHPDTLTKKLREGLAAAVVAAGGQGEETILDLRLAWRWWLADTGQLERVVLDDFRACAAAGVVALFRDRRPPRRSRQGANGCAA